MKNFFVHSLYRIFFPLRSIPLRKKAQYTDDKNQVPEEELSSVKLLNLFRRPAGLKDIEPEHLQQKLTAARMPALIDVRTAMEFNTGHIPGAQLYPLGKEILAAQDLNPDAPVVLICKTGHRSQAAAHTFAELGFRDISHLAGGMDRWKKKKLPLEK